MVCLCVCTLSGAFLYKHIFKKYLSSQLDKHEEACLKTLLCVECGFVLQFVMFPGDLHSSVYKSQRCYNKTNVPF
jgi:hypothetical protein